MIIRIIAILLLAEGVFASLSVQGSISITYDNTMSIDLRASKSSVSDDLDRLIEILRGMEKPRVHLQINLGRKVIEIDGETDLKQEYFKARNDVENILQRTTLLVQDHENYYKKLLHRNSIDYKSLHHVPQEYPNSMNLDKNYLVFSWMLSNPEFALEMARLISRYDLSLEYAKSIQHALLWLNKLLFDVKWRQLHNDRDYISRWRLFNLQRQAKFILDNLVAENQQQHEKPKEGNRSDIILNTEKIEAEEETLMENNKENLSETNKTEISKDKAWENIPNDYIISTEETQMNNSELLKRIKSDIEDKSLTTVKMPINENFNVSTDDNSIVNDTVISKIKTLEDKNLMLNKTSSKSNKFISTLHDNRTKDEKRFGQLENVSSISPREIAIGTLQKTDQPKSTGTGAMHGSLKNVTGILKTRRTLDVPISSKKNKEYDTKNRRVSAKNITGNHHVNEKTAIKLDNASAIDDILEAVDEVFPTDKSVEMLR